MKKITIFLWFFTIISLFFYSFTQVDLNLTLIRHPFFNQIIKSFQTIGYFQRPLSTEIYLFLLVLLFILYLSFLNLAQKGELSHREFWTLLIVSTVILLFSYPAFSYDIYNYMFDAKTIMFYHSNPWQFRPLYFVGDPWLHFMHWTHRPSVYPPVWIGLSLPFYFLGFNFFLPILINFKILITLGFLGSVFVLEKLLYSCHPRPDRGSNNKLNIDSRLRGNDMVGLVLYAFSPLMLIENLVSGHNDIVMIFFALLSFWLILQKKKMLSVICLLLSILTKYVTGVLFPILVFYDWLQKKVSQITIHRYSLILVFVAFCILITKIEIQPWYLVWLMPFVVLSRWRVLWPVVIGFSFGLLLRYVPFLYFGDWNKPVPTYEFWLTLTPLIISILLTPLLLKKKLPFGFFRGRI